MILARRGRASEAAAKYTAGEHSVILDDLVAEDGLGEILKLRGRRYPTYDIASPTMIASVKTHYGPSGAYTERHLQTYVGDFGRMLGFNRAFQSGLSPLEQDAELILQLRSLKLAPLPAEVASSNRQKIVECLENCSVLMVPDNQRDEIVAQLQRVYPEFDGAKLAERVRNLGLTTYEIESIVRNQ